MNAEEKISGKQAFFLIVITIISTEFLYLPATIYREARQSGWLSVVFATLYGLVVAGIVSTLGTSFKGKTFIQYTQSILGKFLGKLIGLVYSIFFLEFTVIVLREFAELLKVSLTETPIIVFLIGIMLPAIYGLYLGLEVVARISEIIVPIFLGFVLFIIFLSIWNIDPGRLTPMLGDGFKPVLRAVFPQTAWFGEIIVMLILIPYIQIPENSRKIALSGMGIVGLFLVLVTVVINGVFGNLTEVLTYPFLTLAEYISIANIIERLESVFIFSWVIGVFLEIAVLHYCTTISWAELFNLKKYQPLIIPVAIITIVLAMVQWTNFMQTLNSLVYLVTIPFAIVEVGIPLILLMVAKIRKLGGEP